MNKKESSQNIDIKLVRCVDFIRENNIGKIDLMKINIEGAEYDLLDDLIETGTVKHIDNLLIQFHDFFPEAKSRMDKIHEHLKQTHESTFCHEFVWEGWKRKSVSSF